MKRFIHELDGTRHCTHAEFRFRFETYLPRALARPGTSCRWDGSAAVEVEVQVEGVAWLKLGAWLSGLNGVKEAATATRHAETDSRSIAGL